MKFPLNSKNSFQNMIKEHAQVIMALRIVGCTWGRIAEIMQVVTTTNEHWGQLDGKEMCEVAAKILNDDPEFSKWSKRTVERNADELLLEAAKKLGW